MTPTDAIALTGDCLVYNAFGSITLVPADAVCPTSAYARLYVSPSTCVDYREATSPGDFVMQFPRSFRDVTQDALSRSAYALAAANAWRSQGRLTPGERRAESLLPAATAAALSSMTVDDVTLFAALSTFGPESCAPASLPVALAAVSLPNPLRWRPVLHLVTRLFAANMPLWPYTGIPVLTVARIWHESALCQYRLVHGFGLALGETTLADFFAQYGAAAAFPVRNEIMRVLAAVGPAFRDGTLPGLDHLRAWYVSYRPYRYAFGADRNGFPAASKIEFTDNPLSVRFGFPPAHSAVFDDFYAKYVYQEAGISPDDGDDYAAEIEAAAVVVAAAPAAALKTYTLPLGEKARGRPKRIDSGPGIAAAAAAAAMTDA